MSFQLWLDVCQGDLYCLPSPAWILLTVTDSFTSFATLFLALCLSALLSAEWLWRRSEILLRRGQETDQTGGGLPQTGRLSPQLTPSHARGPAHSQAAARDGEQQSHPVSDLPGDDDNDDKDNNDFLIHQADKMAPKLNALVPVHACLHTPGGALKFSLEVNTTFVFYSVCIGQASRHSHLGTPICCVWFQTNKWQQVR